MPNPALTRAIDFYAEGVVLPSVHVIDRTDTSPVPVVDETGNPLSLENRQEALEAWSRDNAAWAEAVLAGKEWVSTEPAYTGAAAKAFQKPIQLVSARTVQLPKTLASTDLVPTFPDQETQWRASHVIPWPVMAPLRELEESVQVMLEMGLRDPGQDPT
jgi:hypothetical protein